MMSTAHLMVRCLVRQYGSGQLSYDEMWRMIHHVLYQETAKARGEWVPPVSPLPPQPVPVEESFDDSFDEAIARTQESIRRLQALHG